MKPEGIVCKRGDLLIQRCDNHTANSLVEKYHYLHRKIYIGRNISYSVTHKQFGGEGVLMYGYPVFHTKKCLVGEGQPLSNGELVELCRVYLPPELPTNSESCSIGKSLKMLKQDWKALTGFVPKVIISFADTEFTHRGTIYKASNFMHMGYVKGRKATPSLGHGRWSEAKRQGVGQQPGVRKEVYIYEIAKGVLDLEMLKGTYKQ